MLPAEDADEFAGLEAAMIEKLAPVDALQTVLAARRGRRLAPRPVPQPGGQQADLCEEHRYADGGLGLALIRGPRV